MSDMGKTVARATKWSLITEVVAKIISPIVNMILARLLLPEAFGAVATITMIISFAEIFADAGFQKYIVQHEFQDDEDFDKSVNVAFWSNLMISFVFVVLIWIFKDYLAKFVGSSELGIGIAVASFNIIFVAFSSIQMAIYRRYFKFKILFYVRMITSLIPLVVTVPLAIYFRNYWALLLGTLTMHFVQAVILTIKSQWKPRIYYSLKRLKEMFSFTAWSMMEAIAVWMTSYIGTFIVGIVLNDYYLGIYKTSMTTVNSYIGIVTASIYPVLFSALSRCQDNDAEFKKTYFSFQKMVAIFLMPMSIGMFIYRDLVVQILLGSQWGEASGFIGLWGSMSGFSVVVCYFATAIYQSKGKPKIALFAQVIYLIFLIPTIAISAKYGFKTLYVARSLIRIQYILTALIIASALFKISIRETVKNIFPQVFSALIMGAFAILIKDIVPGRIWQFVTVGICVIVYFGVLMLFPSMRKTIFEVKIVKNVLDKIKK